MKRTVFYDHHIAANAKMVEFAGFEMPIQYADGVLSEHNHTREGAGVFDVSHMQQLRLMGDDAGAALEALLPQAIIELPVGRQRYGFFTNDDGGIIDDLMMSNFGDHIYMVVNASRADVDIAHLKSHLGDRVEVIDDRALLAIQGPKAADVVAAVLPDSAAQKFMDIRTHDWNGHDIIAARSGYTGEDGFELSIPNDAAVEFFDALMAHPDAKLIGLGARDSLRLEAGLCLYGNDIDETTTPIAANLAWGIQKARRTGGAREGGFPGSDKILAEMADAPDQLRVGIAPEGRAPMRGGVKLFADADGKTKIGHITSGGFGPTAGAPVAMGYINREFAASDTPIWAELRGKYQPAKVADLPFVKPNFKR